MMCSQWATSSTCRWSLASANSSALPLMITLLRPLPNWGSHFIVQPYPGVNIDKNSSHHNIDSLSLSLYIYICIYIYTWQIMAKTEGANDYLSIACWRWSAHLVAYWEPLESEPIDSSKKHMYGGLLVDPASGWEMALQNHIVLAKNPCRRTSVLFAGSISPCLLLNQPFLLIIDHPPFCHFISHLPIKSSCEMSWIYTTRIRHPS